MCIFIRFALEINVYDNGVLSQILMGILYHILIMYYVTGLKTRKKFEFWGTFDFKVFKKIMCSCVSNKDVEMVYDGI